MNWKLLTIPAFFIFMSTAQTLFPDRKQQHGHLRILQNLAFACVWIFVVLFFLESPMLTWANQMYVHQFGFFLRIHTPPILYLLFSFLILDFATYWWHRANHRIHFLWRFHQMHHSDLDVDTSSIFRFHFFELSLHYIYKISISVAFGIRPSHLATYEIFLALCSLFHHSNVQLPEKLNIFLQKIIITPAIHLNHHLCQPQFAHSNYGSCLTIWDRIFKTYTNPANDSKIPLGLAQHQNQRDLTFLKSLFVLPFKTDAKMPSKNINKPNII